MKALVYTNPGQMTFREEASQELVAGDLRVRVTAAGICGSDMHAYHGHDARRLPGLILGHEAAGVVIEGPRIGEHVALNPLISCSRCDYCEMGRSNLCSNRTMLGMTRPGAMAAEVTVPAAFALTIPDDMNPVDASLMEPTACAYHALKLVERVVFRPLSESKVLVIGGGAIGILAALLLHDMGCRAIHLSETNGLRRVSAENTHIATVHDPHATTFPNDFDVVFDAVGSTGTRNGAIDAVRPGGVIMHIGLQEAAGAFNARKVTLDEIIFLGAYTYTRADLRASLGALYAGRLGDLGWVETRPLADGARAFADLDAGATAAAKLVLIP